MVYFIGAVIAIISYLIGSISPSILLSKAFGKGDIRESGSGNAGATNMLRTNGVGMGLATLILDISKGIAAVLIGWLVTSICTGRISAVTPVENAILSSLGFIAGIFVVVGHDFPIYFGFKGGKGVATSLGVCLIWDWKVGLVVLVFALFLMLITRYVSLGSISAAVIFLAMEAYKMYEHFNPVELICAAALSLLLIARHSANISRLFKGTENKLSFGKNKKSDQ